MGRGGWEEEVVVVLVVTDEAEVHVMRATSRVTRCAQRMEDGSIGCWADGWMDGWMDLRLKTPGLP
jgi:hypothetical protein